MLALAAHVLLGPLLLSMALRSVHPGLGIAECWMVGASLVITLSVWWRPNRSPRPCFWVAAGLYAAVLALWGALALGHGWGAAWIALTNTIMTVLFLGMYGAKLRRKSWAPHTPSDLAQLFIAGVAVSVIGVAIAAFPGLPIGDVDARLTVWWTTRSVASLWVGAATFFLLLYWLRSPVLTLPGPTETAAGFATGVTFMYLPRYRADLPISWIMLVPAMWAGMRLTPRGAAAYTLLSSIASSVAAAVHPQLARYDGVIASATTVDMLLFFSGVLTLLLALFRDERARLARLIDEERADAQDNADLLAAVFESMTDGLLLADPRARIIMHNPLGASHARAPDPRGRPHVVGDLLGHPLRRRIAGGGRRGTAAAVHPGHRRTAPAGLHAHQLRGRPAHHRRIRAPAAHL